MFSQGKAPLVEPLCDLFIAHSLSFSSPTAIKYVFSIQDPLAHAFHLLNLICPVLPFRYQPL